MEHLGALNAFVQTADCGSFAGAAARLGVSGSAIGKAVARLEERLAVRLFHRSTRSLTLTAEGALFLDRCRRIFSEIEAAELELSQIRQAPRGRLRVSLPLIGMLMMPAVMAFMRAYPEIELDLDFTDRLVDVIDEGFDAVVRTGEARDSRLMMRRAGHSRTGSSDRPIISRRVACLRRPTICSVTPAIITNIRPPASWSAGRWWRTARPLNLFFP